MPLNAQQSFLGYTPLAGLRNLRGTPSQNAFEAMTIRAEKNVVRDPVTKGVLGYTEAAGVSPLAGQTVNIYDPTGTDVIGTKSGPTLQPATQSGGPQGIGNLSAAFAPMDYSGFQKMMAQYQRPTQVAQVTGVQGASSQKRRMGSVGSTFGRGNMQIKSVNI